MEIISIASGSSGNCTYISAGDSQLLIDCGLSARETIRRTASIGLNIEEIEAILITHEHADHINGAFTLSKRYGIPLHINPSTFNAANCPLKNVPIEFFDTGGSFSFKDFRISPFPIPHDAADPVGFRLETPEGIIVYMTDIGWVFPEMTSHADGARAMVLESNHDKEMLKNGPYPWFLKKRISGEKGHLSNDDMAAFLKLISRMELEGLVLAHLSRTNNNAEIALSNARKVIDIRSPGLPVVIADQFNVRRLSLL